MVKATKGTAFHVDTIDLYASRSRSEFARRAAKILGLERDAIETDLLALLVETEAIATTDPTATPDTTAPEITDAERAKVLALWRRPDLLDQVRHSPGEPNQSAFVRVVSIGDDVLALEIRM